MKLVYLLDTNTVSYIARGRSQNAREKLLGLQDDEVACISAITEAEVRYGLAKRPQAAELKRLMEGFLASIRILPWGSDEAQAYGDLRAHLEGSGVTLGNMDMMIAAHAISAHATLVTNDRAFSQVARFSGIENWATDV